MGLACSVATGPAMAMGENEESLLLGCFQGLRLGRVDPPGVEVEALAYRLVGMTEAVPVGDVEDAAVPVGNEIPAPQKHAVQGAGGGGQSGAVLGGDHLLDQSR